MDLVFGILGQYLNVAFIVTVEVRKDTGAGPRISSDSSADADRGMEDILLLEVDFSGTVGVFASRRVQSEI